MKMMIKQILTVATTLSLMQLSWWGSWVDINDYEFGVDTQRLVGQQIHSDNSQHEDQHFLEKEPVAPPIEAEDDN